MLQIESKFWNWISRDWSKVILISSTIIAFLVRYYMRGFISEDMSEYLVPWYDMVKARGGFSSLSAPVGNYTIIYQTIIALFTYIPFKPIYMYKLFSSLFDWLLAVLIGMIIFHANKSKLRASVAYGISLNFPIIVFNSSLWGQCDSIYAFFCLLAMYLLWRRKNMWSFIVLGTAFAFKLQAVFILPFFLFTYVKRRDFSLLHFLWIPVMIIILSLGGILQGVSIGDIFDIYRVQTVTYTRMSLRYAGFWRYIISVDEFDYYLNLFRYGILLAIFVLMLIMICLLRSKDRLSFQSFFSVAFLMTYTCVFFLPSMHERYSFLYLILGLLLCFMDRKTISIFFLLMIVDLATYSDYLFLQDS